MSPFTNVFLTRNIATQLNMIRQLNISRIYFLRSKIYAKNCPTKINVSSSKFISNKSTYILPIFTCILGRRGYNTMSDTFLYLMPINNLQDFIISILCLNWIR